jgi:LPXTG-site transpeptidase (sortase) family protein
MKNLKNRRTLKIITVGVIVFFSIFLQDFFMNLNKNSLNIVLSENRKVDLITEQKSEAKLLRIRIPGISLDSAIESVGITLDGAVGVPKDPFNVAWFNQGPLPGEEGNSIVVGHYGWKNNKPVVFDNLHKLEKEEKIYIEYDDGKVVTFVVRESKKYKYNEEAYDVFVSDDKKAHLNLITCSGDWDEDVGTHLYRLVVFADME